MEYVTNPEMGPFKRLYSNLKDSFAYFGLRGVFKRALSSSHRPRWAPFFLAGGSSCGADVEGVRRPDSSCPSNLSRAQDHSTDGLETKRLRMASSAEPPPLRGDGWGWIFIDWPTNRGRPARSGFRRFGKGPWLPDSNSAREVLTARAIIQASVTPGVQYTASRNCSTRSDGRLTVSLTMWGLWSIAFIVGVPSTRIKCRSFSSVASDLVWVVSGICPPPFKSTVQWIVACETSRK